MNEPRKAKCYWDKLDSKNTVRLSPMGKGYVVHTDDEGKLYVLDKNDERIYIVFS
jgi:hypothetical protein